MHNHHQHRFWAMPADVLGLYPGVQCSCLCVPLTSGSLAVEVCCGVLQHPAGVRAPAACNDPLAGSPAGEWVAAFLAPGSTAVTCSWNSWVVACMGTGVLPLGPVPHMLRGQLGGGFAQHSMVGQAFRQCIACSGTVVGQYRSHGWQFILSSLQARQQITLLLCQPHAPAANPSTAWADFVPVCRTHMRWRT